MPTNSRKLRRVVLTAVLAVTMLVAFASLGGISIATSAIGAAQYQYGKKVTICHKGKTITVAKQALKAHQKHGDTVGRCTAEQVRKGKAAAAKAKAQAAKAKGQARAEAAKAKGQAAKAKGQARAEAAKAKAKAARPAAPAKAAEKARPADTSTTETSRPGNGKGNGNGNGKGKGRK